MNRHCTRYSFHPGHSRNFWVMALGIRKDRPKNVCTLRSYSFSLSDLLDTLHTMLTRSRRCTRHPGQFIKKCGRKMFVCWACSSVSLWFTWYIAYIFTRSRICAIYSFQSSNLGNCRVMALKICINWPKNICTLSFSFRLNLIYLILGTNVI